MNGLSGEYLDIIHDTQYSSSLYIFLSWISSEATNLGKKFVSFAFYCILACFFHLSTFYLNSCSRGRREGSNGGIKFCLKFRNDAWERAINPIQKILDWVFLKDFRDFSSLSPFSLNLLRYLTVSAIRLDFYQLSHFHTFIKLDKLAYFLFMHISARGFLVFRNNKLAFSAVMRTGLLTGLLKIMAPIFPASNPTRFTSNPGNTSWVLTFSLLFCRAITIRGPPIREF